MDKSSKDLPPNFVDQVRVIPASGFEFKPINGRQACPCTRALCYQILMLYKSEVIAAEKLEDFPIFSF